MDRDLWVRPETREWFSKNAQATARRDNVDLLATRYLHAAPSLAERARQRPSSSFAYGRPSRVQLARPGTAAAAVSSLPPWGLSDGPGFYQPPPALRQREERLFAADVMRESQVNRQVSRMRLQATRKSGFLQQKPELQRLPPPGKATRPW